ncbi:MAG TPA: hypothetical protein VNU19_20020 [Candidatus Acidoferrum sp.]|nr:hypothetical protein [Candidatus Acidoferrum sp.]
MDDDIIDDSWNQAALFWVGLFGILATGAMIGVGGDNYWGIGHIDPPFVPQKTTALLGVFVSLVGLCDLLALGVMFAAAVILVQRFRGVSAED